MYYRYFLSYLTVVIPVFLGVFATVPSIILASIIVVFIIAVVITDPAYCTGTSGRCRCSSGGYRCCRCFSWGYSSSTGTWSSQEILNSSQYSKEQKDIYKLFFEINIKMNSLYQICSKKLQAPSATPFFKMASPKVSPPTLMTLILKMCLKTNLSIDLCLTVT